MPKFAEDLYDAQGNYVKTVEWATIGEQVPTPEVMHPPTFPVDRAYAARYNAWVERQRAARRPWH